MASRRFLPSSPWPAAGTGTGTASGEAGGSAAPAGRSEADLLLRRLRALGFRTLAGVRTTENRAVMVSLSRGGVLSIHRGYALAPDRVLRAVVRFFARGTPRALRRAAHHEIVSFPAAAQAGGTCRPTRAADRPRPGDVEHLTRLAALFREANADHFGGALPELPLRLSGRMRTRLGQLCLRHGTHEPFEITLSRRHVERHGWAEVRDTLLHEMVHLWQHVQGLPVDHRGRFRAKAREIGVVPAARRAVRRAPPGRKAARFD